MLDLDRCLYLDFEARSEVSIVDVGAHAYAENPTTDLLCCGWVVGLSASVEMWRPGDEIPMEWRLHDYVWVAQNKDTERQLLLHKMGLDIRRWVDLATVASAAGMPRNLHDIAEALHLPVRKLAKTALMALAKPRKLTKKNAEKWWTRGERPELYTLLEEYCTADVDVMRKALAALPPYHWVMPPKEEKLAVLTDKMNELGVEVDMAGVALAQRVVEAHGAELRAEFATLYPGVNPRYPAGVSAALGTANARKDTVRDALKEMADPEFGVHPLDDRRHRALTLLKTIKTASTAKLKAFQDRTTRDGRLHGAMVFHGAGRTGRWSSMGVQLHNLVRGLGVSTPDWPAVDSAPGAMDRAFAALHSGTLDLMYPDITRAVAAMMRGFVLNSECGLLSGDFSQIEARSLVTWAGQKNMVEAFRRKLDPYKIMAADIYGRDDLKSITKDERFMGKQSVLGAGYGVGKFGFKEMLKLQYDVDITEEESDRIVQAYRKSNPRVKALWYAVERLAKKTILEQPQHLICAIDVPLIAMRMVKNWLVIRLPSGRCLWYHEPELVDEGGNFGPRIYYWGRNQKLGGRWDRVETYGGKLVENATQAMARDVMAEAMLRLDDAGFDVELTVHDEIVAPGPESELEEFESIMREPPKWWPDLPLDVEVQHTRRYQK